MKRLILLFAVMIFMLTGCGNETSVKHDKLIIGVDEEFAPMTFRNEQGELVGFDIDLAKETARRMGVDIEFVPIDWNNKEIDIKSGKVDMIWSGLDIIPERDGNMIFSKPYMDNRQILMVRHGNDKNIYSIADLAGKIVGTQAGSNSEDYVHESKQIADSFADFKTYNNIRESFAALIKNECDVLIIDEIAGRYEMTIHPDMFGVVEVTIGPVTEFGIGFRKDNTELCDRVQKVFDEMIKDGTAKKISEQWFGADLLKPRR